MADILFQLETIAATARIAAPIKNMVTTMSTIQSAQSAVDKAATQNKLLFAVYMLLLLIVAFVSWLLWRSGNSLQDAIRDEARKDIVSANAVAETAKKDAAQANERAEKLENDNLTLRNDLNTESGKVASLQKAASDALAEQQRVQTELEEQRGRTAILEKNASDALTAQQRVETALAEQQERAANAEQALVKIQEQARLTESTLEEESRNRRGLEEWLRPRILPFTVSAGKTSIDPLRPFPNTQVAFEVVDDDEAKQFAGQIAASVEAAGWKVVRAVILPKGVGTRSGVTIESKRNIPDPNRPDTMTTPLANAAHALSDLLEANKHDAVAYEVNLTWPAGVPDTVMIIKVGLKPDTYFSTKDSLEFWQKVLKEENNPQNKKRIESMIEMIKKRRP
jgi:hypothetical protein